MNIAIIGFGRMGQMVKEVAESRGHVVTCIIDLGEEDKFESEAFHNAEVAIEFTAPEAAYTNICRAWEQGVKVVSGTTGWIEKHISDVEHACYDDGKTLFWAANFSVGVAIFAAANSYLAKIMNTFEQYDVSITETHHTHKKDHPSGTAITLAEQIIANLQRKTRWRSGEVVAEKKEQAPLGSPEESEVYIESVRQGEVVGRHEVTYASPEDSITLTHSAHSRRGFALGAVLAAEYTASHSGLLAMSDLITI